MLFYIRIKNLLILYTFEGIQTNPNEDLVNCQLIDLVSGDINNTIVLDYSSSLDSWAALIELDSLGNYINHYDYSYSWPNFSFEDNLLNITGDSIKF